MQPEAVIAITKALSNSRRLRMFTALLESDEPILVTNLATIAEIELGPASMNLTRLANAGLVLKIPSGRYTLYTPNRTTLKSFIDHLTTLLEKQRHESIRPQVLPAAEDTSLQ